MTQAREFRENNSHPLFSPPPIDSNKVNDGISKYSCYKQTNVGFFFCILIKYISAVDEDFPFSPFTVAYLDCDLFNFVLVTNCAPTVLIVGTRWAQNDHLRKDVKIIKENNGNVHPTLTQKTKNYVRGVRKCKIAIYFCYTFPG